MQLPAAVRRVVPASARRIPVWLRLVAVPLVAALVLLAIWLTGGVLTDDFTVAMLLTGAFLAIGGLGALLTGLRWQSLAVPVLATYVIVAGSVGGYLLVTSHRDVVVHEKVAMVADTLPPAPATQPTATTAPRAPRPMAIASGSFTSGEHQTTGTA